MNAVLEPRWIDVCALDDLCPGSGMAAMINGEQIAIFYLPDIEPSLYAIDNHDPFSKANILSRAIVGDLKGHLVIASPMYKQHFDLTTGQCLEDDTVTLKTWAIKSAAGRVLIAE